MTPYLVSAQNNCDSLRMTRENRASSERVRSAWRAFLLWKNWIEHLPRRQAKTAVFKPTPPESSKSSRTQVERSRVFKSRVKQSSRTQGHHLKQQIKNYAEICQSRSARVYIN